MIRVLTRTASYSPSRHNGTTQVLYYNIKAFEDAGIDPASIKTWQDLEAAAKKIYDTTGGSMVGWEPMWGYKKPGRRGVSATAEPF